jgi:ActD protein
MKQEPTEMAIPRAIYGLFPDPDSAERGMNALHRAGVSPGKIVVMSAEPFDEYSFSKMDHATPMPWFAAGGGVVGGTLGFLLARLTQESYPIVTGGMPMLAAWPTGIVTYELTMLGAVLTTVVTLLITTKLPSWKPKLYDPEVSNGKILIGVLEPSDAALAEIENRLRGAGADKVKATGVPV